MAFWLQVTESVILWRTAIHRERKRPPRSASLTRIIATVVVVMTGYTVAVHHLQTGEELLLSMICCLRVLSIRPTCQQVDNICNMVCNLRMPIKLITWHTRMVEDRVIQWRRRKYAIKPWGIGPASRACQRTGRGMADRKGPE